VELSSGYVLDRFTSPLFNEHKIDEANCRKRLKAHMEEYLEFKYE
jgi:hypothetical protein